MRLLGTLNQDDRWLRSAVWVAAIETWRQDREEVIRDEERSRLRGALTKAGVARKRIDAYLAGAKDEALDTSLVFPFRPPYGFGPHEPGQFTTEFILRYHAFDRGGMYRAYGMSFEDLAALRPERVEGILRAMLASADGALVRIAREAIRRIPGTALVEVVRDALGGTEPDVWRALESPDDPAGTAVRLAALVDGAMSAGTDWDRARFWRRLAAGDCDAPVCVEKAIGLLETASRSSEPSPLVPALGAFLESAAARRSDGESRARSVEDWRDWFREHPPREK